MELLVDRVEHYELCITDSGHSVINHIGPDINRHAVHPTRDKGVTSTHDSPCRLAEVSISLPGSA